MPDMPNSLFGLNIPDLKQLAEQIRGGRLDTRTNTKQPQASARSYEQFTRFDTLPAYKELQVMFATAQKLGISSLYFSCHETNATGRTRINGEEFLNFSTYDYLGLCGHAEVNAAAAEAMDAYGTSAGASRLVAGERPPHARLEKALATMLQVEDAVIFVSGHATNISTIATLLGPKDAVYHDALAHNSLILGATYSGAKRYAYPHNDCKALDLLLRKTRASHERVIIATEGLFSMDGTIADLPGLIALKSRYGCFLMVDEAHSMGVLGRTGRGCAEHFGLPHTDVDIWMGTLSKTFCGCGGFIAGAAELITLLKYRAPGFVYSVGMPPSIAAASCKALEIMLREPERTARLQKVSAFFLKEAKARHFNTGTAAGFAVIPIIIGGSIKTARVAARLFEHKIDVMPIIYPAVEEGLARLRFFLSSEHNEEDIVRTLDILAEETA